MNRRPQYSRLCRLIDDTLHPSTERVVISSTKENEKDLLITLSQVLRQVKLWTDEFDCESDNDTMEKPAGNSECSDGSISHSEDHHCLTKIIGDLTFLLAIESQYVQHLAENVLVVISKFVAASGSYWDDFMHSLCLCLELAICNSCSSSLDPPTRARDLDCDSSTVILALKLTLRNANWSSVAGIIRVLRCILKHLKQDFDDQLFKVYLDSVGSCLSNIPWNLLNEIHVGRNESLRSSGGDALVYTMVVHPKLLFMFCGNLVQLFTSLVAQSGSVEAAAGCLNKHPAVCEINIIFPKVLAWCLGKQGDCSNTCFTQYFRHKILMLMARLSVQIHLDCSTLVSWLHLIHKYFQDLLSEPITQMECEQDDCLEGSPFLVSFSAVEKKKASSRHLQRLAVFLFLRCSFSLVNLRERTEEQCLCSNLNSSLVSERNWDPECCVRKKALLELYQWLQRHLPADICVDHELYSERCTSFSLSFLQLYMHEDDILFEVLLQLFCVPSCSEQQFCQGKRTLQVVKDDILLFVSNLFDPIRLFHLFLAELLYDHQVLLDYLISKDTGARSAEYLLRCLRTVCDSWNLFMEFSLGGSITNQSCCKKRKFLVDGCDFQGASYADVEGDGMRLSLDKECEKEHIYGSKHHRTDRLPFEDAMECLLSLKNSVENLHKKNLFPYNPEVLLRRLTKFQELCLKP